MKKTKELDVLKQSLLFEDTPDIVDDMRKMAYEDWAMHLKKLFVHNKKLSAEIRKLRKELSKCKTSP